MKDLTNGRTSNRARTSSQGIEDIWDAALEAIQENDDVVFGCFRKHFQDLGHLVLHVLFTQRAHGHDTGRGRECVSERVCECA